MLQILKSGSATAYKIFKDTPKNILNFVIDKWHELKDIKRKLLNLKQSNLELGIEHIYNGNIKDAVFRFKFILKFLDKNSKEAHYWLAWCYFLDNKNNKAKMHLMIAKDLDHKKLGDFLNNHEIQEIPETIYQQYLNLSCYHPWRYEQTYLENQEDLYKNAIDLALEYFEEIPQDCSILDLGASRGETFLSLNQRIEKNYHLTGVNISDEMANQLIAFDDLKYDEITIMSYQEFINKTSEKYNLIFAINSLIFTAKLKDYFIALNKICKDAGVVTLALPSKTLGVHYKYDQSNKFFIYDESFILNQLKLADIKNFSINRLNHGKSIKYLIVTWQKTN